ncbi:MAG: hypothetical protein ACM32J_07275, partial [Rhizobacter sp.]
PLRKNLGKKNCELSDEDIQRICDTFVRFEETEQSKIFPNCAFGYSNPLRWVLAHGQRRYNQALADWCDRWPERWWLPLPYENLQATDSVLMADDGFHPGPAVYALWAEQLAAIISTQIVPRLTETTPTRQLLAQAEARRRMRGAP